MDQMSFLSPSVVGNTKQLECGPMPNMMAAQPMYIAPLLNAVDKYQN